MGLSIVMPRADGAFSIPEVVARISGDTAYWIVRLSRTMTAENDIRV
jgi:hypothetical protein